MFFLALVAYLPVLPLDVSPPTRHPGPSSPQDHAFQHWGHLHPHRFTCCILV